MGRVRITNNSLNSYGTRVLTEGVNLEQYQRNPVLLYMHQRGLVIGLVKDIKVEGDEVTGELVFDEATELSRQCKQQWEFGSLKMVSAGLIIQEMSESKEQLVEGQTSPTITKSKLYEVSVVDVGANDDAIVLMHEGKQVTLGMDSSSPLPLLSEKSKVKREESDNITLKTKEEMDIATLALTLGLPSTATEEEVNAKLAELQAAKAENDTLAQQLKAAQDSNAAMTLASITALVDAAINEKKINADKKQHFIELGKKVGVDTLKTTLDAMAPQVKLTQAIEQGKEGGETASPWEKRMEEIHMGLSKS